MAMCHLSNYHLLRPTFFFSPRRLCPPLVLKTSESSFVRRLALVRSSEQSSDKVRISRNRKSDEEICEELREFISLAGLPLKRMPSLKVLSDNGRIDLAKIIKKRGYKSFSKLFQSSIERNGIEEDLSDKILEDKGACEEEGIYRIDDGIVPLSELPDMYQVGLNGFASNGSCNSETIEEPLMAKQTNYTDKATIIERIDISSDEIISGEEKPVVSLVGDCPSDELTNIKEKSVLPVVNESGNYVAINSLKALLDRSDKELSELKQKIEEEKIELSNLQEKAKAKVANVDQAIKEKSFVIHDSEEKIKEKSCVIHDAEEKIKGLKEVRIEFMADAEVVEIAGSFNGWQHRLNMDLDPSSNAEDPSNFRQPLLWSTVLWLYPGVYQIKFIVDGNWRVDHKREVVTIENFANNVLRVEK